MLMAAGMLILFSLSRLHRALRACSELAKRTNAFAATEHLKISHSCLITALIALILSRICPTPLEGWNKITASCISHTKPIVADQRFLNALPKGALTLHRQLFR
jgi:hypothetical protein